METQIAALIVAAVIGAIGGLLYLIVPPSEVKPLNTWLEKLVLAVERVVTGAIAGALFSPALIAVVEQVGWKVDWTLIAVLITLLSTGYFGIDIVKAMLKKPGTVPGVGPG